MIGPDFLHVTPLSLPEVSVPTGTAAAITGTATRASTGILIQAPASNTADVYIGAAGVTASTGVILIPGGSISIELADASKVYAISGSANQKLRVLVV
ncbi:MULTISPECIES: hypothetical protein [Sorangium]|uniref:IPT/TIG domain-containing protein n=1 Tax=Sorangium cellulosum TaxID=56 RepID=A0A4P2QP59_SORCE|nr:MULTISPECIES: hypothetical protein [Sorangium]AUX31937.1 uncharacterized protein SOCE836_040720 [Sorangium cellulosum]WCQ91311.1 hypothetical protein NQZ70_04027 [Sorangium sp. Soce836]